jgi:hypothetical protein
MAFTNTLTVLNALKAKLEALQWTPQAGPAEAAFKRVDLFDISEIETALEELFVFKDRVCFVILDSEHFDNEATTSTKVISKMTRSVALLIADRNYGKRQKALIGTDASPGVIALKDIVLNGDDRPDSSVIGLLRDGVTDLRVYCRPVNGVFIRLQDKKRENLAGRIVYEQDIEIRGGFFEATLGRGPIL